MNRTSLPISPFTTALSGSARETELRIRNMFQWKKKRPPVWLMALTGTAILLCGSLVSCQEAPAGRQAQSSQASAASLSTPPPNITSDLNHNGIPEEIRLVNRAKWLLIGELNMTEQEAHRYIEKQAMDRCVTKRAVAEQILSTYK